MTREERIARKRRLRKKKRFRMKLAISRKTITAFFGFYLLIAVFLLVVPRSKESQIEKRELTQWPKFSVASYFSGEYTAGIATFYDDTVPFRDTFKNINNNIKSLFGISAGSDNVQIVGNVHKVDENENTAKAAEAGQTAGDAAAEAAAQEAAAQEAAAAEAAAEAAAAEAAAQEAAAQEAAAAEAAAQAAAAQAEATEAAANANAANAAAEGTYQNGFLIFQMNGHWRGLPLFGGGACANYINFLNNLAADLGEGVRVYAMPIPLASQYYLPANYQEYSVNQVTKIQEVFSQLNPNVIRVDVSTVLNDHKGEDIYLRTDHHWSALGAYYATAVLANAAGVNYPSLDTYTPQSVDGYVGSLYGYTQNANLLNDPETFVWYTTDVWQSCDFYDGSFNYVRTRTIPIPVSKVNASYMTFMGGDNQIVKIRTAANNGRKLLVLKDSYANAGMPFLLSSFDEIWIADTRYCELNVVDLVQQKGITDVVFYADMDTVASQTVQPLEELRTGNNKGAAIVDNAPDQEQPPVG